MAANGLSRKLEVSIPTAECAAETARDAARPSTGSPIRQPASNYFVLVRSTGARLVAACHAVSLFVHA